MVIHQAICFRFGFLLPHQTFKNTWVEMGNANDRCYYIWPSFIYQIWIFSEKKFICYWMETIMDKDRIPTLTQTLSSLNKEFLHCSQRELVDKSLGSKFWQIESFGIGSKRAGTGSQSLGFDFPVNGYIFMLTVHI